MSWKWQENQERGRKTKEGVKWKDCGQERKLKKSEKTCARRTDVVVVVVYHLTTTATTSTTFVTHRINSKEAFLCPF